MFTWMISFVRNTDHDRQAHPACNCWPFLDNYKHNHNIGWNHKSLLGFGHKRVYRQVRRKTGPSLALRSDSIYLSGAYYTVLTFLIITATDCSPIGLSQSRSPPRMMIRTMIWPSLYARWPSCRNLHYLQDLPGIGTEHHCPLPHSNRNYPDCASASDISLAYFKKLMMIRRFYWWISNFIIKPVVQPVS